MIHWNCLAPSKAATDFTDFTNSYAHMARAYRGAPNDAVVFACILEAAGNTGFW
jgi:hypothetical protein